MDGEDVLEVVGEVLAGVLGVAATALMVVLVLRYGVVGLHDRAVWGTRWVVEVVAYGLPSVREPDPVESWPMPPPPAVCACDQPGQVVSILAYDTPDGAPYVIRVVCGRCWDVVPAYRAVEVWAVSRGLVERQASCGHEGVEEVFAYGDTQPIRVVCEDCGLALER